jgi:hypothetical protein
MVFVAILVMLSRLSSARVDAAMNPAPTAESENDDHGGNLDEPQANDTEHGLASSKCETALDTQ